VVRSNMVLSKYLPYLKMVRRYVVVVLKKPPLQSRVAGKDVACCSELEPRFRDANCLLSGARGRGGATLALLHKVTTDWCKQGRKLQDTYHSIRYLLPCALQYGLLCG
jgi:hypothetical protein